MLSYILPVDSSKTPQNDSSSAPTNQQQQRLQLSLVPGRFAANGDATNTTATTTPISKETSVSSFASDATTATISHNTSSSMTNTSASDRHKAKIVVNGKHPTLKRVSFGSSKGSMVETLIYESPLQEDGQPSPICENVAQPFPEDCDQTEAEREKVRVSFFQQSKPQEVDLPDETCFITDADFVMATTVAENNAGHISYNRTESTESGWDNPFRPGGDLSKEADEIVELIKGGKPITPTPDGSLPPLPSLDQADSPANLKNAINESHQKSAANAQNLGASPKSSANGNVQQNEKPVTPGAVEIQRGTAVQPGDASQVEHVTIKKKPKCKCCVIQ